MIWTDPTDSKHPVTSQLPADGPVGDIRHVLDMDVTMDSCPAALDICDSRAVVAMVRLEVQGSGEVPMDCGNDCAEWDFRNEFETIDGKPVYYGGDLCDSDDSEWDDPWDLAYREHVDQYNFDALDGMELKVFERLKAVEEPTMMVGEVPGQGLSRRNLNASLMDLAETGKLLTGEHDVSGVAESPIRWTSEMPDGSGTFFYYEGDLSDSYCGSVEDRERDAWDDWCDSAFHNGYGGFFPDAEKTRPPVVFGDQLFWDDDMAESSRVLPDGGDVAVSTSPILVGTIVLLALPDTDRTSRLDNNKLEVLDRWISEFSVLSRGTDDTFCDTIVLEGDALATCASDNGILDGEEGGYASCIPYAREIQETIMS